MCSRICPNLLSDMDGARWHGALCRCFCGYLFGKQKKEVLCREDIVPWILIVLITAAGLITLAVTSWDVIQAELNSVYPGAAPPSSGGNGLWWMMKYPISLLGRINNNDPLIVENSSVICFAPAGFLLALWVLFKEKKKDPLLILLVGLDVFFCLVLLRGCANVAF